MKTILSIGLIGVLMSSGVAVAQGTPNPTPGVGDAVAGAAAAAGDNIFEGARQAGAIAAQGASRLLGPDEGPAEGAPAGAAGAGAEVVEANPGDNAPVVLAPGTVTGGRMESGIIAETSRVGEELMVLQQRQSLFTQIQQTIDMIGVENALRLYPEYASYLDTSPMALKSQLDRVKVMNELREEVARANGPTEYELALKAAEAEAAAAEPAVGTPGEVDLMSMAVNDSGQGLPAPVAAEPEEPAEPTLTREDVAALIEEARLRDEAEAEEAAETAPRTPLYALTLDEVYGANGQMVAVLTDGTSTYKVRAGDEVPNIGVITSIERDNVVMSADGESHIIKFQ